MWGLFCSTNVYWMETDLRILATNLAWWEVAQNLQNLRHVICKLEWLENRRDYRFVSLKKLDFVNLDHFELCRLKLQLPGINKKIAFQWTVGCQNSLFHCYEVINSCERNCCKFAVKDLEHESYSSVPKKRAGPNKRAG